MFLKKKKAYIIRQKDMCHRRMHPFQGLNFNDRQVVVSYMNAMAKRKKGGNQDWTTEYRRTQMVF